MTQRKQILIGTMVILGCILLLNLSRAQDVNTPDHSDTVHSSDTLASRLVQNDLSSVHAEVRQVERIYGQTIDHVMSLITIWGALITGAFLLFGIIFPIIWQKKVNKFWESRFKAHAEDINEQLKDALNEVKEKSEKLLIDLKDHSEAFSYAVANYIFAKASLEKAIADPTKHYEALEHLTLCLGQLTELRPSERLPELYQKCLDGIICCSKYRRDEFNRDNISLLQISLNRIKTYPAAQIPSIYTRMDQIDTWLRAPSAVGISMKTHRAI